MTKTFKKTIQMFLVAVFAVALTLSASLLIKPQTAKAAEMTVTFSNAYIEGDNAEKTGYLQVRMDTNGQTWTNSYNNKAVSELPGNVADTVTINGRTLRELDSACNSASSVVVTMQPAGSFSFIRVWVPLDFMTTSDVYSVGVLEGFEFVDGTTTIKGTAVTYLRDSNSMFTASSYSALNKLSSANISIGDAQLIHRRTIEDPTNYSGRGADSYVVQISWGQSFGEYDVMYNGYASVRRAIYINGKSIDEWNAQAIASDSKFAEASTYTYFPQNSTDAGHDVFRKPVGLWGYSGGFILTIYQELVSDCEEIVVTVGSGCWFDGSFMVSERISKTVFTQSVVDVTNKLTFLDNSHNSPADWGATSMYYINTADEACWTKAPIGGCLNECDPSNAAGGQIQMKYVYFNGSTLWDINATDNGSYNSTQGNIASGGIYAPILVTMSSELGSSLKLTLPTAYTNGKSGHEEIIVKKGFSVYENGVSYYVSRDIIFTNTGSGWTTTVVAEEIATEVTGVITYANRTDGGSNENFILFQLSNNDYASCSTTAISDISGLYGYIDIDGTMLNSQPAEPFFNVWNIKNTVAFRAPGLDATGVQNLTYITIKAGAKFPSYNTQIGGPATYYVTTQDVTFVKSGTSDTWSVGSVPEATPMHTVTFMVLDEVYHTVEVEDGSAVRAYGGLPATPADREDANYTYTFTGNWINRADGSSFSARTIVNSDLIIDAEYTATEKEDVPVDITSEITFVHQVQQNVGTETYMIRTQNNYWTKAPQGGCLNEYDVEDAGAGQEQMKYLYLNGTSLYDINRDDDGSYGSEQGNIASGGRYAPILVLMGSDGGNYSYIQLHVPTGYPNQEASANENHKTISIKAGFTVVENDVTYTVTQDLTWYNVNGTWKSQNEVISSNDISFQNARREGLANELYKIDIYSAKWTITCNYYDFMYGGDFAEYRKQIYINGVSVYDINASVNDSSYVYSTFPMTGADDATFAHPVLVETQAQGGDPNTITLWLHESYVQSLNYNVTITFGAGYNAYADGKVVGLDVSYTLAFHTVRVDNGSSTTTQYVLDGDKAIEPTPSKGMTATTIFEFENWYYVNTNTVFNFATSITESIEVEARFTEATVNLINVEVSGMVHHLKTERNDNWLIITLSESDYPADLNTYPLPNSGAELLRIDFLDKIILKGTIELGGSTYAQVTLRDVYNQHGFSEGPYLNIWAEANSIAIRLAVGSGVTEIIVESGCQFPSYAYVSGATSTDTRLVIKQTTACVDKASDGLFVKQGAVATDIYMEAGASVRITENMATSGLRFQTNVSKETIAQLQALIASGEYSAISFGTIIVPTDYIMGGVLTHSWLDKNGVSYLDITCTATLENMAWPKETTDYYSFFGSIVKLKTSNYNRAFSGLGYIKFVDGNGVVTYSYALYESSNSRSASFVAKAATADRNATETDFYNNYVEADSNYSPYTPSENLFLKSYITWASDVEAIEPETLTSLANVGGYATITIDEDKQALNGPYVELVYSTNVNVWGVFTYTDGNKTANEDFYLQAGTSNHRQYLDVFRYNGVGYGMDIENLKMTSIKFTNAELEQTVTGKVKILGLYSEDETIDTENQEIYVTVAQDDGSEMTVGAHLGIGGSLTYLAKSGVYEGVIGGSSGWKNGTVAISTDPSVFDSTNRYKSGSSSSSYSTEAGYYGHATSSRPEDGAVNLINNFDAGRQFQQSWYAEVDDANGYTRTLCYTGSSEGQYWPYNPVQAGDVVSNPGQIVDYEINTTKGYIYVKARAMDWAKGYDEENPIDGTVVGGVTTKSYVENYYRLNSDGTLVVNNKFIDWNGFNDMDSCDWASTELPACYPVHTLNYYVSNIDGDGTWSDAIEYNNTLSGWTTNPYHQYANSSQGLTKVEDWFAWANGNTANAFGMGVYIPNVSRYTSGRTNQSTAYYIDNNFQNSNALPVPDYKSWFTSQVSAHAQRGNILAYKGMMSNMQPIQYTYQSAYVSNTSYTAPGIDFRMEAYVPIEYSYVICLGTVGTIRETFHEIYSNGTITNAGNAYEKVGLDAWARADKSWTW